jgi:hypothetical protein
MYSQLQRIRMQAEEQQDTVFAAFSALYLPATVERFLNSPTTINPDRDAVEDLQLYNAYFETLVAIQHTPYFAKYLRSTKAIAAGGKLLPQALAQRLVQLGPRWERQIINPPSDKPDGYYSSAAGSTIQLLSTLCTAFIKESDQNIVIPQETKNALIPLLRRWARRRDFLGTVSTRVLDILLSPSFCVGVNNVRRQLKNWNICGMPNCIIKTDLKACGRSGLVAPICSVTLILYLDVRLCAMWVVDSILTRRDH